MKSSSVEIYKISEALPWVRRASMTRNLLTDVGMESRKREGMGVDWPGEGAAVVPKWLERAGDGPALSAHYFCAQFGNRDLSACPWSLPSPTPWPLCLYRHFNSSRVTLEQVATLCTFGCLSVLLGGWTQRRLSVRGGLALKMMQMQTEVALAAL